MNDIIKRKIRLLTTTGATSGCDNCYIIIPDTGVTYNLKIQLNAEAIDLGYFDADVDGVDANTPSSSINYVVTGYSKSRLFELEKYTISTDLEKKYFLYDGNYGALFDPDISGLDLNKTITGSSLNIYEYYVSGIKYDDYIPVSGESYTTFRFISEGFSSSNFINKYYYKDFDNEFIISKPNVSSDVFIIRQQINVFENNYRLKNISNINTLDSYGGGSFFNVVKNT